MTTTDTTVSFIVKRHFAVWLEDAFEVQVPASELEAYETPDEWALDNLNALYSRAHDTADTAVVLLWEDEHQADLDFPESEVTVVTP